MKKKIVSIIIPCYNDAQYIEQAVDSALNQTYPHIEVIVVDDGSNEETKLVLKKLELKITKLITQENQGQSTARNIGISKATGEYILVLDSDDFFDKEFCEKAIMVINKYSDVTIVTCQAKILHNDKFNEIYIPKGGNILNFKFSNDALGTSLFRKIDWNACGGYDESMRKGYEDWEFFIRLLKNGGNAFVIQEPLHNYRIRKNSTSTRANSNKYEILKYILLKHKDLYIKDYENLIQFLLNKIEREEKNKLKILNKIDYKIGNMLLMPLRKIKHILKAL